MTRGPFYALAGLLAVAFLGGLGLAAPSAAELGWIEHEMTCAELLATPEAPTGTVRLTDCALAPAEPAVADALFFLGGETDVDGLGVTEAHVRLFPAGGPRHERRAVLLFTTDETLRRWAATAGAGRSRFESTQTSPRRRFLERHHDELRAPRTFEGVLEPLVISPHRFAVDRPAPDADEVLVLAPPPPSRGSRPFGIALALCGGLSLLVLVLLQRRWTRRRDELTGTSPPPLTF